MTISPKTALQMLEGKRIEISDLSDLSKESRDVVSLDQQSVGRLSRMDALQGQAMAKEAQRRRDVELLRIEQAFQRLEDGDFGYCVECDAKIPLKRLEIDPAATHCVQCASLLEKLKKN
nr:TraR/DksA C4-type zinc finger protein [uncultured Cohaesibacter sp.]